MDLIDIIEKFYFREKQLKKKFTAGPIYDRYYAGKYDYSRENWAHYNATPDFLEELEKRDKGFLDGFYVIRIYGKRGLGKTEVAQKIVWNRMQNMKKFHGKDINVWWGFKFDDTVRNIKKAQPGDIIVETEISRTSGKGSQVTTEALENLIDTMRSHGLAFIFVSPKLKKKLDSILDPEFYIKVIRRNDDERICECILKISDDDTGEIVPYGKLFVKLHDDEELRRQVLEAEREYKERLKRNRGFVGVDWDPEKEKEDVETVLEFLKNYDFPDYVDITKLSDVLAEIPLEQLVPGPIDYQKRIAKKAYRRWIHELEALTVKRNKEEELKMLIPPDAFADPTDYFLERIEVKYGTIAREIMKQLFEGKTYKEVAEDEKIKAAGYGSLPRISELKKKIGEESVGYWYEEWLRAQYGDKREEYGSGIPDVITRDGKVISAKCSLEMRKEVGAFHPESDCNPEMEYCLENNIESFVLDFFNPFWKEPYRHQQVEINVLDPPLRITFYNFMSPSIRYRKKPNKDEKVEIVREM